ncbi:MAG: hypothetical protein GY835_04970, partial [bacterium]|nr:hypothetical protein [bacterium]
LKGYKLPEYQGSDDSLRVRLSYGAMSGRVEAIAFPAGSFAGSEVEWEIDSGDSGEPATEATITAPWGHETEYDISEKGRTERITFNSVPVHDRGSATAQNLETEFTYICEGILDTCNDGRLESVTGADGSQQINCYVDSEQGECGDLSGSRHRLALANVLRVVNDGSEAINQPQYPYSNISTSIGYQDDNLPSAIDDGLGRHIDISVPMVDETSSTVFAEEGVSASYTHDSFARVKTFTGGAGPTLNFSFDPDEGGRTEAGLLHRIERAEDGMWQEFEYDDAGNPKVATTSFDTRTEIDHDELNRPIRVMRGKKDSAFSRECIPGANQPTISERAFDAANHL